jgi:glycosyltransferase involved in cell wall biosynthesis
MSEGNILLTIAIPTYNRLECLQELLPNLVRQCEPYQEIEILVSDNCTTDGTSQYIKDIMTANPQVLYRVNFSNVGADENFVRCVENAHGTYVWLFGDDEIVCEGALNSIITTLKINPVSLLIVGFDQRLGYNKSYFFKSFKEFVDFIEPNVLMEQSLITCNIFRKDIFNIQIARKRILSNLGHMYAIIDTLKKRGTVYLLNTPIFTVKDQRAPTDTLLVFPTLKGMRYLLYLGKTYPKLLVYFCRYTVGIFYRKILNSGRRNRYDTRR